MSKINSLETHVESAGGLTAKVLRAHLYDSTYQGDKYGELSAAYLDIAGASASFSLEETRKLIAGLTAIADSVEALRKQPTFQDELNAAEVGTNLYVKGGADYTKVEGNRWRRVGSHLPPRPVGADNFLGTADDYVLTPPPKEPDLHAQLEAAEVGSTLVAKKGGLTYVKDADGWRLNGRPENYVYSTKAFFKDASKYTLTPPLTWDDEKTAAPTGSKILNRTNGREFVKLGTGDWVSLATGWTFKSADGGFPLHRSNYELTLADAK